MKYASTLPITALTALGAITLLVNGGVIPPGADILDTLKGTAGEYQFLLICLVIFLESIVYVGFYFPGQFFAVILVISSQPTPADILMLTFAMVTAATLGSTVNYVIGRFSSKQQSDDKTSIKHLLLAMIHMNSLAFFMLAQGANGRSLKIVGLAGVLNLPYYLALIAVTAYLSEEVMQMAENTGLLFFLIFIWLAIALGIDVKNRRQQKTQTR